jgi:acyl-CoA hydrolase
MEIGIKVIAEDIRTQVVRHVNSCFFTMVAVDENRSPVAVPPLHPTLPDEIRRQEAALVRKRLRKELEQRSVAAREAKPSKDGDSPDQ